MDHLYQYYGRSRRLERMAPLVATIVWKIYRIARPNINLVREITFYYDGHYFTGRYIRTGRGCLEIVEPVEHPYERTVCIITNLVEAIALDLQKVLDTFLHQKHHELTLEIDNVASSEYKTPEIQSNDTIL